MRIVLHIGKEAFVTSPLRKICRYFCLRRACVLWMASLRCTSRNRVIELSSGFRLSNIFAHPDQYVHERKKKSKTISIRVKSIECESKFLYYKRTGTIIFSAVTRGKGWSSLIWEFFENLICSSTYQPIVQIKSGSSLRHYEKQFNRYYIFNYVGQADTQEFR